MLNKRKFQRKKEDFSCCYCGNEVKGNGYTDHCPKCLWSQHTDINPGDREETCKGMMQPVKLEMKSGKYVIHYKCFKCYFEHKVKAVKDDDLSCLL